MHRAERAAANRRLEGVQPGCAATAGVHACRHGLWKGQAPTTGLAAAAFRVASTLYRHKSIPHRDAVGQPSHAILKHSCIQMKQLNSQLNSTRSV